MFKKIGLALIACALVVAAFGQKQPNIIIILSDDAGYADFSFQSDRLIPTPHIDRIANEGAKFTNAYVSASVCSPSRAGLLTGINQPQFGHVSNYIKGVKYSIEQGQYGIPHNVKILPEYLKPLGYATAAFGKWHEGFATEFQPQNRGFDHFWGFLWGSNNYNPGTAKDVMENNQTVDPATIPYMTDAITNEALSFLSKNDKKPFFLYVAYNAVHSPMQAKPEHLKMFQDKFPDDKKRATLAAMTYSLDENVGKILSHLEKTKQLEHTIIFFLNDNGGSDHIAASNFPLRGFKGSLYEGGIRVPFAVRWPGQIKAQTVCNTTVSSLDILPSIMDAVGLQKHNVEGVSVLESVLHPQSYDSRTLRWKTGQRSGAIRTGNWKLIVNEDKEELYDLGADPSEKQNLLTSQPKVYKALKANYEQWFSSLPPAYFYPVSGSSAWKTAVSPNETRP
ncbi:sulfatase-like hydrolase/transferase [Niabella insulamsoli]|uniref:sulfatase-like hydrolase/transferase n=1 Tax=Niabella insulamsoli TaxID=3144874 RepID=UPI0031FC7760